MNMRLSLVLPRETLKNKLRVETKEGRKSNSSHTQRNSSASHRSSCVLEFVSLISSPLTSASEHLSCYIYTSKHSHQRQISTIKYKDSYRNPFNGTAPQKIIRIRRERRRIEFYKIQNALRIMQLRGRITDKNILQYILKKLLFTFWLLYNVYSFGKSAF